MSGRGLFLVDRPGAAQSVLRLGGVGPARTTIDYVPLEVMNTLLGGSFTSRLNDNLREQHGYAYGARSAFRMRRQAGLFLAAADVQTASTGEALKEFVKELDRIRTPAKKDEVERARNYVALGYAQGFETTRQVAQRMAELANFDFPDTEFQTFVPRVQQVEVKDVQKVGQLHVDAANMAVVVVGDRQKIEKELKAADLGAITVWTVEDVMGPAPKIESKPAEPDRE